MYAATVSAARAESSPRMALAPMPIVRTATASLVASPRERALYNVVPRKSPRARADPAYHPRPPSAATALRDLDVFERHVHRLETLTRPAPRDVKRQQTLDLEMELPLAAEVRADEAQCHASTPVSARPSKAASNGPHHQTAATGLVGDSITLARVQSVLLAEGEPCPYARAQFLMSAHDSNGNGRLTSQELATVVSDLTAERLTRGGIAGRLQQELRHAWMLVNELTSQLRAHHASGPRPAPPPHDTRVHAPAAPMSSSANGPVTAADGIARPAALAPRPVAKVPAEPTRPCGPWRMRPPMVSPGYGCM